MTIHLSSHGLFPCPICGEGLEVRQSKRAKPYVICNRDGVQMFVRTELGIEKFKALVAQAETRNIWGRLRDLENQYQRRCPECMKAFWASDSLLVTSWFDGSVVGYRCPEKDCGGIAKAGDGR